MIIFYQRYQNPPIQIDLHCKYIFPMYMVGVILDTLQQVESYLLMREYDGLMKSGRISGRSSTGSYGAGQ